MNYKNERIELKFSWFYAMVYIYMNDSVRQSEKRSGLIDAYQ